MSHTVEVGADDRPTLMLNMRCGVRDKIMWMPEKFQWHLKFKGQIGDDLEYCKQHNINLAIAKGICSEEFMAAREQAFLNALRVWNAVDKSPRKRIVVPERRLHVQMVPVPTCKAISHTDSDREGEDHDGDE